jgi:MFS family permease
MLAAFTYRDFRVQWFGACTSSIGTWTQLTAQNWLVLSMTESAFYLGLDAFLQQLPIMLFTLIGGVLADRLDRRRTLLMSQYVQMATAVMLAALVFQVVQIWRILLLSFDRASPIIWRAGVSAHPVARGQKICRTPSRSSSSSTSRACWVHSPLAG